jgi:hypothetical protein
MRIQYVGQKIMREMWRIVLVAKWRENDHDKGKETYWRQTVTASGEEASEDSLLFCLCGISGEVASK